MTTMKAIHLKQYGAPHKLSLIDLPIPEPSSNQIRIRVRAASINPIDWKLRQGQLKYIYPLKLPVVLGYDVAGEVDAVGGHVKEFQQGDKVYCRSDDRAGGAYAQYMVTGADAVAKIPDNLAFEQAAAVPLAALTALQSLRDYGQIKVGDRVLINGASGGVGLFAVQIAKHLGAYVVGVCSGKNVSMVKEIGADEVIDYTQQNFKELFIRDYNRFDIIFDAVSNTNLKNCRQILKPTGHYISLLPSPSLLLRRFTNPILWGPQAHFVLMQASGNDLRVLNPLLQKGVLKIIIDSTFLLKNIVAAHTKSETGRARGKIIINIGEE